MRDEGNDAHLPGAHGAHQGEHLIDAGDQHGPQLVRWCTLGLHGLGRGWGRVALRWRYGRCALARGGCLDLRRHCTALRSGDRDFAICGAKGIPRFYEQYLPEASMSSSTNSHAVNALSSLQKRVTAPIPSS